MDSDIAAIRTPPRGFAPLAALLTSRAFPAWLARLGIAWASRKRSPLKVGKRVVAVRHADVSEMLHRDLDFVIAPVNAERICAVNGGPFILGMDRSPQLIREREALYSALAELDPGEIGAAVQEEAAVCLASAGKSFDAIADYARPIAATTAGRIFGISPPEREMFMEAVRAIFAHTFLNLGGDTKVEARALAAAPLMQGWFETEIARRRKAGETGQDLMGRLLAGKMLDDEGVRRTLGGMLVGSIDTTASTFARVFCVIGADARLRAQVIEAWVEGRDIYGYCLEALRCWPHNPILLRHAAADTVLGGLPVSAGTRVIAWTQAAMQDPEAFPDPKRLLSDRPAGAYLHYGAGLHPCAGRVVNAVQISALVGSLLAAGAERDGKMRWAGPFPDGLPVRIAREAAQ